MTGNDTHRRDATEDQDADRSQRQGQEQSQLDPDVPADSVSHDAIREAARLGTTDAYLVEQDMEDIDQRQGEDGLDGRPSPLANADNPER